MRRILIAGIGNVFHGDDAFGVAVVRELGRRHWPDSVEVVDFGIRAYDLAYALTDGYDTIVLVDAAPRGLAPGTVQLLEPELPGLEPLDGAIVDAHALNPVSALHMARALGGPKGRILLVGCEPARLESEDGHLGLSQPVQAAVARAVAMIASLVQDFLGGLPTTNPGLVPT